MCEQADYALKNHGISNDAILVLATAGTDYSSLNLPSSNTEGYSNHGGRTSSRKESVGYS